MGVSITLSTELMENENIEGEYVKRKHVTKHLPKVRLTYSPA